MKITKKQLKQIIKEELGRVFEGYEKRPDGVLVDLYEFSNLVTGAESQVTITAKDSRSKAPETMTLSLVEEEASTTARVLGSTAFVTTDMLGAPFNVKRLGKYTFVLS